MVPPGAPPGGLEDGLDGPLTILVGGAVRLGIAGPSTYSLRIELDRGRPGFAWRFWISWTAAFWRVRRVVPRIAAFTVGLAVSRFDWSSCGVGVGILSMPTGLPGVSSHLRTET